MPISYLIKIALCAGWLCCSSTAFAQRDTAKVPVDSMKWRKYKPTGLRVGTDVISIARNYYDKSFQGWEVNADMDFNRFFLAVDYGQWARVFHTNHTTLDSGIVVPSGSEHYTNEGNYYRVGVDVNFLKKDPDKNMFFIGFRYGRSRFTETLVVNKEDPLWGDLNSNGPLVNSNFKANWLELTTGLRVKMYKILWMGYTARFKFGVNTNKNGAVIPSDIPGYGQTARETTWGFNYQVFIRIPVRKAPPSVDVNKK